MPSKFERLLQILGEMNGAAIAFSGGVDSTFLLAAAKQALGDRVLAVIGRSPLHPKAEHLEALEMAGNLGVRVKVVNTHELEDIAFRANPRNRCAICKEGIMRAILALAEKERLDNVLDGSNVDDLGDYRPGVEAAHDLGVRSPLIEAGLGKSDIRRFSKEMGLHTWDKPSMACMASRIPYGEEINEAKLARIESAEALVRAMGITQLRVRDHGTVARIEVLPEDIPKLAERTSREKLVASIKSCGYSYVCLDLDGYRTGSMNETLADE